MLTKKQFRSSIVPLLIVLSLPGVFTSAFGQTSEKKGTTILFGGDIYFGETYQSRLEEQGKTNVLKSNGYDYSLDKIGILLRNADQVVANLETPLTDIASSPFSEDEKYKIHKGDIRETPATLKKFNIKVVSLANNHAMDYGETGLRQTLKILTDSSIAWFGAGLTEAKAAMPYHFSCTLGKKSHDIIIVGGLDYSVKYDSIYRFYADTNKVGVKAWSTEKAVEQIKSIRTAYSTAFIIACPHWFENYVWKTERETDLAHALIDAGADLVLGSGPHMFQELELYKNKWIIYSLGNLAFNSPGRYVKKDANPFSYAAMLELVEGKKDVSIGLKLYPILSNNLETNYQPRFVSESEFETVQHLLLSHSINVSPEKNYSIGKDCVSYFINLNLYQ